MARRIAHSFQKNKTQKLFIVVAIDIGDISFFFLGLLLTLRYGYHLFGINGFNERLKGVFGFVLVEHQKTSHVPYELRSPNYHIISAQYRTSYLRKGLSCPFYKIVGPIPAIIGPGSNIYVRSQIKMFDQQNIRRDLTFDTTLKCPIPH